MKKLFRSIFVSIVFLSLVYIGMGQKTAIYTNPEAEYRFGTELFQKEKYGAAQEKFENVIELERNPFSPLRINAEYYDAICALELYHKDAEYKLYEFIKNHPTNSRKNLVSFQLGRFTYRNKKYNSAQKYFAEVDISELSKNQTTEYYFKTGYCYFKTEKFSEAKSAFQKVEIESKYSSPAKYYLSHIAYVEGDYDTALVGFEDLSMDANFKTIAPFYVVQILFLQEKYKEVLEMAPPLLDKASSKRAPEIARVIGESYYNTGQFKQALPYLEQYHKTSRHKKSREDYFKLGFAQYVNEQFPGAIRNLQKASGPNDQLSQYAYYYLAACYLKTEQKKFAADAFNSAYKLNYDIEIREDALFNYAQLAFELSYDPYSGAIKALKTYLKTYPGSERNDDAYNFLYEISMATRNFGDAQEALESIQKKGKDYNKKYQKITFYRGVELFNQFKYEEAGEMFTKARELKADSEVTVECVFWMAESFYRQQNYWAAKKYYLEFLSSKGAKKAPLYNMANYNLGYSYFNRKEYNGATFYFKDFIAKQSTEEPAIVADAFLRLGDSWFINKGYDNALSYYDKAIRLNTLDVDYAIFQKAITLGVLQRYNEKVQALKTIIDKYPNSSYRSEVQYELGNTYLVQNDNENALLNFRKITSDYPGSSYAVKALLKSGLIYYNSNQNELALLTFKKVIADYPATPESKEALASVRNIYVDMGQAERYFEYAKGLSFADVSANEQDSISYVAAENKYLTEGCADSGELLQAYVNRFSNGIYLVSANYYLAECLVKNEKLVEALVSYEFVVGKPKSEFTESALIKAADLSFKLEQYEKALGYFENLEKTSESKINTVEALYGQMKCHNLLGHSEEAAGFASKLLSVEKISEEMKLEAMMIKANSLFDSDELLLAKSAYKKVVAFSQGEAGAESKYRIAQIEFQLKDYEQSEKSVFDLINNYAPYDYWVASGFILLADIYFEKDNVFQAKQTLQSIIDNYEGEELKAVAIQKLDRMLLSEQAEVGLSNEDSLNYEPDVINLEGELIEVE